VREPRSRRNHRTPQADLAPPEPVRPVGYFRHDQALVESRRIGQGTRIGAFAHILPTSVIGEDCHVSDRVFIGDGVVLGERVIIHHGAELLDGITLEDDVRVGPNAVFSREPAPGSEPFQGLPPRTVVRRGTSIGANATILSGLEVGRNASVAAGAVVTANVPAHAIVAGNPARVTGFLRADGRASLTALRLAPGFVSATGPGGARFVPLPLILEERGHLSFGQTGEHLPFQAKRYFLVFQVPEGETRGGHAHRACHQFLVCAKGRCRLLLDDGHERQEVLLDTPAIGVHIPPMVWGLQYQYSTDAVLLVLTSETYDPADYVRDYEQYYSMVTGTPERSR